MESESVSMKIKSHRSMSNNLKCYLCEDTFVSRIDLSHHMKTSHPRKFKCRQCDKSFSTGSQLESHLEEHGALKKYKCEVCAKTFHFEWRLEKHLKMHNSEIVVRKCHFFNNVKECPFAVIGCKCLHEEAVICKYKEQCKYDKCQFRH